MEGVVATYFDEWYGRDGTWGVLLRSRPMVVNDPLRFHTLVLSFQGMCKDRDTSSQLYGRTTRDSDRRFCDLTLSFQGLGGSHRTNRVMRDSHKLQAFVAFYEFVVANRKLIHNEYIPGEFPNNMLQIVKCSAKVVNGWEVSDVEKSRFLQITDILHRILVE